MTQNNTIIFNGKKQGIEIQMLVNSSEKGLTTYSTIMKKDGEETILQEEQSYNPLFKDSNKYQFFNIIDFIVVRTQLLICYNDFGHVFMDKYIFIDNTVEKQERLFIGRHQVMSYENGGDITSTLIEKQIGEDVFFHIVARQMFGGSLIGLYVYRQDKISQIIFTETQKMTVLKSVCIGEYVKTWYSENKNSINNTEQDISRLNLLSDFYNKPFGYFKMTPDDKKYSEEKTYLRRSGLNNYISFGVDDGKNIEETELNETVKNIANILLQYGNVQINSIHLEAYMIGDAFEGFSIAKINRYSINDFTIPNYSGDMVYFFIRINQSQLYIVRYKMEQDVWLISDYIEEEISSQP